MPVGGVKEKLIAAHRAGIRKVIMSKKNEKDLREVPMSVKKEMEFAFVENINELTMAVFGKMTPPHFYESLLGPPYVEDFGVKSENNF